MISSRPPPPPENWDILRNHRYTVGVTSIDGRGYDSEDEALRSKAIDIETEIQVWDEADMPLVDTDGQYFLKVNTDSLHFYREGRAQLLTISTDHPDGWSIEVPAGVQWIDPISQLIGPSDIKAEVDVECEAFTPANSVETHRESYITIKAGRIRRNIKIYQSSEAELTIEVTPTSLVFKKNAATAKSFSVTTYPTGQPVFFSINGTISGWQASPLIYSGMANLGTYSVLPDPNTQGELLSSIITVYVQDGDRIIPQTVSVSQLLDDLIFNFNHPQNPYEAGGGAINATVDSDTHWQIASWDDKGLPEASGMITITDQSRHEAGYNEPYSFVLASNPYWQPRTAYLKATSTDEDFPTQDVTVNQNYFPLNSGWSFTEGSRFVDVISDTGDKSAGTVYPGSMYANQQADGYITLTPVQYTDILIMPAAGDIETSVILKTENHSPHSPATEYIVPVKLKIPAYFDYVNYSIASGSPFTYAGGVIRAHVNTNATWGWTGNGLGSGTNQTAVPASIYGQKTIDNTVGANTTWSAVNQPAVKPTRAVNLNLVYYDENGVLQSESHYTSNQTGYYVTASSRTTTNVSGTGGTIVVSLTVHYPATTQTRVVVSGTNTVVSDVRNAGLGLTLYINDTGAARTLMAQYQHNTTWVNVGAGFNQPSAGYTVGNIIVETSDRSAANWSTANATCNGIGGGWRLPNQSELNNIGGASIGSKTYTTIYHTNGTAQGSFWGWSSAQFSNSGYYYSYSVNGSASVVYTSNWHEQARHYRCVK